MAKRNPAKPVPMTRAGRDLRATQQAALHSALAKFVARRGNQSAAGKPVTEQDQGLTAALDYSAPTAADLVHPASATGSEIRGDLTTDSPEAPQSPASPPDGTLPVQGEERRPESASAQETAIQREVAPEIGAFRVEQLGMSQCRFACTADDVPRGQHRFCGAPTEIGPGNRWGSWCPKHLPRVFSDTSTMARPAFLKNAERSAR